MIKLGGDDKHIKKVLDEECAKLVMKFKDQDNWSRKYRTSW